MRKRQKKKILKRLGEYHRKCIELRELTKNQIVKADAAYMEIVINELIKSEFTRYFPNQESPYAKIG